MAIGRGDLCTVALTGDYGKPRPALIIQADVFALLPSVTLLPLTSDVRDLSAFRISISPSPENGLSTPSQVMVDKAVTVPRAKLGYYIGRVDRTTMRAVEVAIARFLGLI
jgi:mRNA interferase MazF